MPQLILNPWFLIFLMSWLVIFLVFKPKITKLTLENPREKTSKQTQKTHNWTWTWPWP